MANLDRDYYLDKQGLQTFVNELETNVIAEEYSSSATYTVDAYCTHDNKLYRCTTAISTAEAWNSAHWTLVLIGDELKSKKSGTVTSVTIKGTSPIVSSSESAITTSGTRTISHANSGVTAGTYKSVTVNATGHVTDGTNPTTLSGYGITDAKITSGTITLGSDSITPITSHQTVTDNNPTLDWGTQSKVATIGSTDIHVNLPDNPNTDTKVRQTLIATNYDRPLLMSAVNTSSTTQNIDNVAYRNNSIYANPSTGLLGATTFLGALQGNADTATIATKLSNTTKIGDTNQPVYFSNQGVPESINYTIDKSVPADAVFTDTTYENKPAVKDGTDVSLVTTGDKYNWDNSIEQIYNYIRFPYISNIDKVPYLFRKSGGSLSVGDWEEDKLVGGSVAFNQLIQNGDFPDGAESSWSATGSTIAFSDNKCTVTASSTIANASNIRQNVLAGKENHIIFASQTITSSKYVGGAFYIGENYTTAIPVQANTRTVVEAIEKTKSSYSNTQLYFYFNRSGTLERYDTLTIENAFAIDLTQMFGEEVAEYFYSLETEEQGEGVKAFRSLFPNVYYAYNTGEIISVKTSAHKTTGKNLFSSAIAQGALYTSGSENTTTTTRVKTLDYIRCLPETVYTVSLNSGLQSVSAVYYDINKEYLSGENISGQTATITTPVNCSYIRFCFAKSSTSQAITPSDITEAQLEQGSTATTYEPYEEHIYPLDSNLELRGSIKLDTVTNTLYNDGDTYESDGNVVRKYGYIEFDGSSDENWEFYNNTIFRISFTDAAGNQGLISNWLPTSSGSTFGIRATTAYILCYQILSNIPSVTDLASWKTYLSTHPLQVRYTLATPVSETATPFTNPQRVFNNGTEQYIDNRTIAMPVGHETKYQYSI